MYPTIHNTIGALQTGSLIAIFLFGIITLQADVYFRTYRNDKWYFKTLVVVVLTLEFGHTVCVAYEVYNASIANAGRPILMLAGSGFPALGVSLSIGGAITLLVHGFFALRIWETAPSPSKYIGPLSCIVALLRFIGSIFLSVKAVKASNMTQYREENSWLVIAVLGSGVAVDFAVAIPMLRHLVEKRKESMQRITVFIDRVVHFTMRSNLVTACAAAGVLITYLSLPDTLVWGAFYAFLAKLYTNSLLCALNDRFELRKPAFGSRPISHSPAARNARGPRPDINDTSLTVSIEMKTSVQADDTKPSFGESNQIRAPLNTYRSTGPQRPLYHRPTDFPSPPTSPQTSAGRFR